MDIRVLLFLFVSLLLFGCSSGPVAKSESVKLKVVENKTFEWGASSDNATAGKLSSIGFEQNSVEFSSNTVALLNKNIEILKANRDVKIQLEGHCNPIKNPKWDVSFALKRAENVKKYLVSKGIDEKRISLISFGREKPVVENKSEIYKNRRVNFVVSYR